MHPIPSHAKVAINTVIDLLHRRWVMRILWELRHKALSFRELRSACDEVSPTLLNQRLAELREFKLVEHTAGSGYQLTTQGQGLLAAAMPLFEWATVWWPGLGQEGG